MEKILFGILVSAVFLVCSIAQSQEVERTSIGVGVEYRTKTMNLEPTQFTPPLEDLDAKYNAFDIEQEYDMPVVLLHLRFLDNIDLAFLFGLLNFDLTQDSDLAGFGHDFTSDSTNAFGFTGEILLPMTEKIYIGFFFEHFTSELDEVEFSSDPPSLSFLNEGVPVVIDSVTPERLKYHETTLTPVAAYKWGRFMPYAGPRFTSGSADMDVTYVIRGRDLERDIKYGPIESWSLVVGLKAQISDNLSLNAEAETVENESYKIGITYTF